MKKLYKIIFISFLIIGTIISISANSWIGIWLGLEINLISIIPLLTKQKNIISSEASLKYFITQAIASTILIFSIIMIINKTNTINNLEFYQYLNMILNSALLTKMGAAPFHFWFPEVIEGLRWINCLIILTWQKIAPIVLLMYNITTIYFITIIIIFSIVIRGIIGLNQTSLRKILAYSSINHIAWIISSIIFLETIWIYYFTIYSLIRINIILIFNILKTFYLKQLFSSFNRNIPIKLIFIINFLSLGGLPPFLGFFPKWITIQTIVENNLIRIPFIIVITTLLTLYFYIRITFSTTLIRVEETNWTTNKNLKKFNNFRIISFNFIMIIRLVLCTIIFNWL